VRHGTASLFAALDVHSGHVRAEPIPGKNDSVDAVLAIHVILDNGSSHVSKHTKAWFAAHPR